MNRVSIQMYGLVCALALFCVSARATTIVLPTDAQLVDKSPLIVSGIVLATTPVDRGGAIWTETRVAVTRTIKGTTDETITIHEPGGILGDRITRIFGAPEFTEDESVLLFLIPGDAGKYRVMDLFAGKFGEGRTLDGRRLWMRANDAEVTLLDHEFEAIEATNVQREAVAFEHFVREQVAGRKAAENYGIENPVLANETSGGKVKSNFTLMNESGPPARWYVFDDGGAAAWYHGGVQTGYSNGGLSELQTAMAVWVNYSAAKIRYTYAGALTVAAKGTGSRNAVNEVLFSDPLNEIAGTWSLSQGGVVGLGGYNGLGGAKNFTATFQADAAHPAGTMPAYEITEANLTIQDNVSPANGISSAILGEIIAHEFGHTLGFGHSPSTTALMFASVTRLGPSLRDDDMVAARWLYPNGNAQPPQQQVPSAPSSLTATVSGSNVDLSWTDNSSDETSFAVYLAAGSGAYTRVGDVPANTRNARVSALSAGSYRVYIVAANAVGESGGSNTATFTIAGVPTAAFSFTPQSGNAGVTNFTFFDESKGTITSRSWSFGDGATSTASVATHVYATSGTFPVTLTVTGPGGTSFITHNVAVNGPISALFNWSPSIPIVNEAVQFTDLSGGVPTSWSWSFGDGTTSTEQNPSKKYGAQGTYNVSLTVTRNGLSSTTSREVVVTGFTPGTIPVVAAFDASVVTATPGQTVAFLDRSTGTPSQWTWNFGDDAGSNAQNPAHAYGAPGVYTVTLTAAKPGSSSQATKQIVVATPVPYRALISAAAQTGGSGGTTWRTELSLVNTGLEGATVTLRFLPSLAEKTLFLAPRQSVTYANALFEAFGLSSGAGAVTIDADSAGSIAQLRVTSRTFTTGAVGTYGQSVPEVQPRQLEKTLYVTGIQSTSAYRTNIGLVNRGAAEITPTLTLYAQNGAVIATKNVRLDASSFQQSALWAFFPEVQGATHDVLTLKISSNQADAVSAYASVVDNITQDPIYIQAVPAPAEKSLTIPAVGRAPGANGTFWRSDLTLFNPNSEAMDVTLRYNGTNKTMNVAAKDTLVLPDVLSSFGATSGSGALFASWTAPAGPVVTSRTYTSVETGGTFGQSIDPIAALAATSFVPGLRNDASFRSNVGFLNGGDDTETFTVVALSPFGTELARDTITLAPKEQRQYSVSSLFANVNSSSFTLAVQGDVDAKLFAYGSMVDNASGDPVFFSGL
ncbi:MAG TPA: PKD domain-containing protein [Thermoanaerobaculia bacterium]|nr:PKD domain-containing protein [Thermoanaerobaculia bacterium]